MKYFNVKTEYDGIKFDSKKEAMHYAILKGLENNGVIKNLRRQVPFVLITGQRWSDGKKHRDTIYKADFVYEHEGKTIVEDVKGFRTKEYKIKKELMKDRHGIEVREI